MKKLLSATLAVFMLFAGYSQVNAQEVTFPNIHNVTELHEHITSNLKEDISLNEDGTLNISEIDFGNLDKELVDSYKEVVKSVNEGVEDGILKYESDFELSVATVEELRELSNVKESKSNKDEITARAIPDEPAKYPLARTAYENLDDLKGKEKAFEQAARFNPSINPWLSTASYFAVQVRPGGAWDLKREIGWNNTRTVKIDGETYYLTGEDIGNIHYGYVGRYHFGTKTLLSAAGMVQILAGTAKLSWFDSYFDDPTDQKAIRRGINWYLNDSFE
ncbi:polymorphic toxin type 44 domain-containing protein [Brevibacillus laterosporus]|uniref:polymorphic toxin type 44 domain-containing protein n=1 Tax=Brevibacillus laterosporus TaxID=1465 RepID=UPI002E1B524A|nr:polymorphic toxin type 44 domain-containing protein [Brevibacillus laterosporus]MED1667274.1 polymorphic toxin type 44 domain-containing protein [Brevibacillus laterosporus]MED1719658.1 polymorphic toxin type 44 domain-containing protein [Brevibacillus laterosporus]